MEGSYWNNDFRTLFLSFYYFYACCCCCCFVGAAVFSDFVILLSLLLLYIFIKFVFVLCGYVRYYFVNLSGIPVIYVCDIRLPFYVIFNICNFIFTFFIALSWILFSDLLTVSLINFPYSIIVMTILS